jgi:Kef-type K+ transport system membrane component KefB
MLVLAVTVSVHVTGFSWGFLGWELLQLAVFVPLVLFGAGSLARAAIVRYGEKPEIRVMILLVVIALCAEGAHIIQLAGIVGAFLAGIVIKRAVRGNSRSSSSKSETSEHESQSRILCFCSLA